jgi:PHD/YefM family antitoxin component YafN of YafNO toxin-antitoxin module
MIEVSAAEFTRNFGRYEEAAQREPVAITSHGRTSGYFLSAVEFEAYLRMKPRTTRALHVSEMPQEMVDQIAATRMDQAHDHLNALLDEDGGP